MSSGLLQRICEIPLASEFCEGSDVKWTAAMNTFSMRILWMQWCQADYCRESFITITLRILRMQWCQEDYWEEFFICHQTENFVNAVMSSRLLHRIFLMLLVCKFGNAVISSGLLQKILMIFSAWEFCECSDVKQSAVKNIFGMKFCERSNVKGTYAKIWKCCLHGNL